MLLKEIAVCCEDLEKHRVIPDGQSVWFLYAEAHETYSNHKFPKPSLVVSAWSHLKIHISHMESLTPCNIWLWIYNGLWIILAQETWHESALYIYRDSSWMRFTPFVIHTLVSYGFTGLTLREMFSCRLFLVMCPLVRLAYLVFFL
jgi:hypothetical protein